MSGTLARLNVLIGANTAELNRTLDDAMGRVGQMGQRLQSAGRTMSRRFTAPLVGAGAAATALAVRTGKLADELLDMEQQTGLSTDALQEYRRVTNAAGVDQDAVGRAAEQLTMRLSRGAEGSADMRMAMEELGISLRDAAGNMRPMEEIVNESIASLADMEDATERNVLATQLFSRGAQELAPILGMGSEEIERLRQEAHDMGLVLSGESLDAANEFRQEWDTMTQSFGASVSEIGLALIPVISELVGMIQDHVVPAVRAAVNWLADMDPVVLKVTAGIAAAAAVAGPLMLFVGSLLKIVAAAKLVGPAILKIGTIATGPVGLSILAFAALAAGGKALVDNWDIIKFEVEQLVRKIQEWLGDKLEAVVGRVKGVVDGVSGAFSWLSDRLVGNSIIPDMVDAIGDEFSRMGGIMDQGLDAVVAFAQGSDRALGDFVKSALTNLAKIGLGKILPTEGFFGSLFGGFFADGGFLGPGQIGVVGERGPELVQAGPRGMTITPNHAVGGGPSAGAVAAALLQQMPAVGDVPPEAAAVHRWYRRLYAAMAADGKDRGVGV